jgi:toxoflavin biosynthesis protein ToxD
LPSGEPVWVDVPAGEFTMGGHGQSDGKPAHRVNLPAFKIAKVPITNTQYRFFVEAVRYATPQHWSNDKVPPGLENHPVIYVSWPDALAYCRWLSEVSGKAITLPSEAQWEKAARGGFSPVTDGEDLEGARAYPWGEIWDETKCNSSELGIGGTTPVGIFPDGVSPSGCLDMAGNVWEWTSTRKKDYPYNPNDGREDPAGDDRRVLRGGGWSDSRDFARCASRRYDHPLNRYDNLGFRCVLSPGSGS